LLGSPSEQIKEATKNQGVGFLVDDYIRKYGNNKLVAIRLIGKLM
jgi:hypothetical protein